MGTRQALFWTEMLSCSFLFSQFLNQEHLYSRLPTRGYRESVEASGSSGHPVTPEFKFSGSFMAVDGGVEDVKKMAFLPHKKEHKGILSIDPMVELSWKSIDYSAPIEESMLLVGKSTGMLSTTSGGFSPQTVGVGQMKLEAPTMIFWQKAIRGLSMANPNEALHKFGALHPYRLVGCGGYEGRGCTELLGECGLAGCSGRP